MKQSKPRLQCMPFRNLSLFWKYLLMMLCVLLLCLCTMMVNNRRSLDSLKAENVEKMQLTLERNCSLLSRELHSAYMIPEIIEDFRNYDYIRNAHSEVVDNKYITVLYLLRQTLSQQVTLRGNSSDCVVYFSNINSVITPSYTIPYAEDCFSKYYRLSVTEEEALMEALDTPGTLQLLPMQRLRYEYKNAPVNVMGLVVRPSYSSTGVVSFYSESYILDILGMTYFPEGTLLRITDTDGNVLADYTGSETPDLSHYSSLQCSLNNLDAEVTVYVPNRVFSDQIRPVRQSGIVSIVLVTLIGVLMALFFSKASVQPIRGLLARHADRAPKARTNEITQLDTLLIDARKSAERINKQLTQQILTRAITGAALSEQDERHLTQMYAVLSSGYRVAVFHAPSAINELLEDHLLHHIDGAAFALISRKETGMLMPADEEHLHQLNSIIEELNRLAAEKGILCGISSPAIGFAGIHKAVRQARAALPKEKGVKLFPGGLIDNRSISWLQHERLYQSIFTCNEEQALQLLEGIASVTNPLNAREIYYNIRFVLRSAAEEMDLPLPSQSDSDYAPNLLPQENIYNLKAILEELFRSLQEKNEHSYDERDRSILQYIQDSLDDFNLCAASVGAHFGISERRIYDIIRQQTGTSFNGYLTSLRMKKAEILLSTTNLSISEIGTRCGYRIPGTFHRLFKETYDMTPGQLRSSCRNGAEQPGSTDSTK